MVNYCAVAQCRYFHFFFHNNASYKFKPNTLVKMAWRT